VDVDSLLNKSAYYRARAAAVRAIAAALPDEMASTTLLAVAADYDRLAAAQDKRLIESTAPPAKGANDA
jgi:hypothetical protein